MQQALAGLWIHRDSIGWNSPPPDVTTAEGLPIRRPFPFRELRGVLYSPRWDEKADLRYGVS
ncbi:MAG: hypothetical protein JSU89_07255, partial [Myxococcales bacterium]